MVSRTTSLGETVWQDRYFVGNHPAFDFVNTIAHRFDEDQNEDRFQGPADLQHWSRHVSLITEETLPAEPEQALDEVAFSETLELREKAHAVFMARLDNRVPQAADLAFIVQRLDDPQTLIQFNSPKTFSSSFSYRADTKSINAALALQILDALFRLPVDRVRACPACGWMFYDTTRGGRRRWCNMKTCGNRAKVQEYRMRTRTKNRHKGKGPGAP
ncbi:MAG: CGNR zinc finger domain-containing protein [Pseudomonadota bacterium]